MSDAPRGLAGRSRVFEVTVTCRARLVLDQSVLDAVDDDWRRQFYDHVRTADDVASHVALNMVRHQHAEVSAIDGFANLAEGAASLEDEEWDVEEVSGG